MKDRQKIFLDKVTKILVEDTIIDYDKGRVQYPFFRHDLYSSIFTLFHPIYAFVFFSKYCKERYGLTDEEIKYVWDQYKDIMTDKFSNNNER